MTDRMIQYHSDEEQSSLLTNTSMLSEFEKDLLEKSINKEWANPKFKLKWFVGQTQITPFAKFRQWLLELKSREESIETLEYEIKKYQIDLERHLHKAENAPNEFDRREAELEAENIKRNQIKTKRRLNNWYLERQQLLDLIQEFLDSDEKYLPDGSGRTYLDIIGTDEEDIYEAEYWTNRLAKQSATDLLFYGRVNTGNMDAILSMSPEQQNETLALSVSYASQLQQTQNALQLEVDQQLGIESRLVDSSLTLPKQETLTEDNTSTSQTGDILNVYNS